MLQFQNYVRAQSLEQAYTLNQNRRARVLGGMLWLRTEGGTAGTAIDLSALGLDTIQRTGEGWAIGAMVPLRTLERHPELNAMTGGAFAKALAPIVGVQFRNLATVGGSVWGRFGFSDVLTLLLTLDAEVELYHAGRMPLAQFAELAPDRDILVRVLVPDAAIRVSYQAVRIARTDLPLLTCAAALPQNAAPRLIIGARPMRAMPVEDTQGILSAGVTPESIRAFADYAAGAVPTGANSRGSAEYRTHLVKVLTTRALGGLIQ